MNNFTPRFFLPFLYLIVGSAAFGAGNSPSPGSRTQGAPQTGGEKIDIDAIRQKYLSQAEDNEIRVVQNRQHTKKGKISLGIHAGSISTDPFLSVRNLGGSLGYYFNEFWGTEFLGWKSFANGSSALDTLYQSTKPHQTTDTNKPSSFYGLQFLFSPIYGKLSVLGKLIVYYDLNLVGGAGLTGTASGSYLTPFIGLDQRVYVGKYTSLGISYHFMEYSEKVLKANPSVPGEIAGERTNYSSVVMLSMLFSIQVF